MGASEVKNKEGRKLIKMYQKKHRTLTQSKDDRHMLRLFNLYGGKKGFLDEREAKIFIRDVLFVCELTKEVPDLRATIDAIFTELDSTNSNRVLYQELLKPSWGKVQDLLHTVYGKMNKLQQINASGTESSGHLKDEPNHTLSLFPISHPVKVDSDSNLSESELEECCPPSFICPISTEIMNDPVILVETGTTYDRKYIEQWLQNNNTDPSTGLQLTSKEVLHVLALKNAIEEWKEDMKKKKEKKDAKERMKAQMDDHEKVEEAEKIDIPEIVEISERVHHGLTTMSQEKVKAMEEQLLWKSQELSDLQIESLELPEKLEKIEKIEKSEISEKSEKSERSERSEATFRTRIRIRVVHNEGRKEQLDFSNSLVEKDAKEEASLAGSLEILQNAKETSGDSSESSGHEVDEYAM